jgi:elongation factor G
VQRVLDAVVDYLPSPLGSPACQRHQHRHRRRRNSSCFGRGSFCRTRIQAPGRSISSARSRSSAYTGHISAGDTVYNSANNKKERIGRMVRLQADKREDVKTVYAGEIAAFVGMKEVKIGNTVCDADHPIALESIVFPEPVVSMRIEPNTKADQEKMGIALSRLSDEDPTFRIKSDPETGETIISGMGELHLEIIVDRMKREFGVQATTGKPQVAYRETIQGRADVEYKHIKQTGGRGQYGHVKIRMKPMEPIEEGVKIKNNVDREDHFEFINNIKGGVIPQEYIQPVKKGLQEAMDRGVLAGFPVVDVSVDLYDGSYHDVDSSEIAFKLAAINAFQEAAQKAKPVILEPIMKLEVVTPEKFMGDVTGMINSKRGSIEAMGERGQARVITAKVPLSEMFGFTTQLRSLTEGRGVSPTSNSLTTLSSLATCRKTLDCFSPKINTHGAIVSAGSLSTV